MKNVFISLALVSLLAVSLSSVAQSSTDKKAVKEITADSSREKAAFKEAKKNTVPLAVSDLKSDEQNRQYKIVDGRKVLVDTQGIQSLATPDQMEAKKKEKTTNTTPLK